MGDVHNRDVVVVEHADWCFPFRRHLPGNLEHTEAEIEAGIGVTSDGRPFIKEVCHECPSGRRQTSDSDDSLIREPSLWRWKAGPLPGLRVALKELNFLTGSDRKSVWTTGCCLSPSSLP
jgi:hypothetical protein